jgi:hypothetical protein
MSAGEAQILDSALAEYTRKDKDVKTSALAVVVSSENIGKMKVRVIDTTIQVGSYDSLKDVLAVAATDICNPRKRSTNRGYIPSNNGSMVAPTEKPSGGGGGCFPHDASVLLEDGRNVAMSELQIGDRVQSIDPLTGRQFFDQVVTFLHRTLHGSGKQFTYTRLTLDTGSSISLTPFHLIYRIKANDVVNVKRQQETLFPLVSPVFASRVEPGDFLVASGNGSDIHQVMEVSTEKRDGGHFVPLTTSGNIVVDGTLASCYAKYELHDLIHLAMAPLQAFCRTAEFLINSPKAVGLQQASLLPDGEHRYSSALLKMGQFLPLNYLPSF